MKKIYFLAAALLATSTMQAQTTVDFEELTLPNAESFYDGADNAGSFTSNDVIFNCKYNTQYSFMSSGFAYSNKTDNTTAGYTNMYSAYPASGAGNSTIYAVNFGGDTLSFANANGVNLSQVELTNTTYAYLSMKDGDAVGKKFGSVNDASGNPDGTNGEDYFYITISGFDKDSAFVDSVQFYLADFRSADAAQDYIVDSWKTVDLSSLVGVKYLTFAYHSSDVGQYGMNTPAYFAMDNLTYTLNTASVDKNSLETFILYPNPANDYVTLEGGNGAYGIFNLQGKNVQTIQDVATTQTISVANLKAGVYFVKSLDHPFAPVQKLILK